MQELKKYNLIFYAHKEFLIYKMNNQTLALNLVDQGVHF